MDEYKLPNPKNEADWFKCVVLSYKTLKGVDYANRSWDKVHWGRAAKSAKALLEICGSVRSADACLVDMAKSFDDKELSWTLETVVKHAHDWISKKRGVRNGNTYRTGLLEALSQRARSGDHSPDSQEETPLPDTARSLEPLKKADFKDIN